MSETTQSGASVAGSTPERISGGPADECPWCGEPADQPCYSWRGNPMQRKHVEVFAGVYVPKVKPLTDDAAGGTS